MTLTLPGARRPMTVDPAHVGALSAEVLDAHAVVVAYGGEALHVVVDAAVEVRGLDAAVAQVRGLAPDALLDEVRGLSARVGLDAYEQAALARLEAAGVAALADDDPAPKRAVVAGLALLLIRVLVRTAPR